MNYIRQVRFRNAAPIYRDRAEGKIEGEYSMSLPRIIVLGAGLGGTIAAYEIREATKGRAEVMVVSDTDDYWFVPSNPWVAVRWRERHAALPSVVGTA